jgi:hypothetical protein
VAKSEIEKAGSQKVKSQSGLSNGEGKGAFRGCPTTTTITTEVIRLELNESGAAKEGRGKVGWHLLIFPVREMMMSCSAS